MYPNLVRRFHFKGLKFIYKVTTVDNFMQAKAQLFGHIGLLSGIGLIFTDQFHPLSNLLFGYPLKYHPFRNSKTTRFQVRQGQMLKNQPKSVFLYLLIIER
jgi:hypothetical protein